MCGRQQRAGASQRTRRAAAVRTAILRTIAGGREVLQDFVHRAGDEVRQEARRVGHDAASEVLVGMVEVNLDRGARPAGRGARGARSAAGSGGTAAAVSCL